jgi:hypothetical protein
MPPPEYFKNARLKIKQKVEQQFGAGPYTKEQKQFIRKEVKKKMMMKIRARLSYEFRKIRFEKNKVRLRIPGYNIKGVSFFPSQLIRHFKPEEIRRAASKYLKLKERYHI